MTTDVYDFLEHRGVKGMKWGHRKARPLPYNQPRQQKDHSTRNAVLITAAIVGGAAIAGTLLGKHGNRKALEALKQSPNTVNRSNKIWEGVKAVKLSALPKAPGSSWEKIPNYEKLRVPGGSWEAIPKFNFR